MSKEIGFLAKTEWGDGVWQNEPDRFEWIDEATGYPCLAKRAMTHGAWCGYVGIPREHNCYGKNIYDLDLNIDVHGGLTYGAECDGNLETGICHKADKDDVFWYGFDCAHYCDFEPAIEAMHRDILVSYMTSNYKDFLDKLPPEWNPLEERLLKKTYRDLDFVKSECTKLVKQLKELE